MSSIRAHVHFEQEGSRLTAVGIVVSSYQVQVSGRTLQLVERIVIERQDGGSIDGQLTEATKAAILPIAFAEANSELDSKGAGEASSSA